MYDSKRAEIDAMRIRFEREVEDRSSGARSTGTEYLRVLSDFIDIFESGAGADERLRGLDTTGELQRLEDQSEWAERERHRVRRMLDQIA
jgi:hypothetical protein